MALKKNLEIHSYVLYRVWDIVSLGALGRPRKFYGTPVILNQLRKMERRDAAHETAVGRNQVEVCTQLKKYRRRPPHVSLKNPSTERDRLNNENVEVTCANSSYCVVR